MSEDHPPANRPRLTEKARSEAEHRRQRQAEALRANLLKRKQQARDRAEEGSRIAQGQNTETE